MQTTLLDYTAEIKQQQHPALCVSEASLALYEHFCDQR